MRAALSAEATYSIRIATWQALFAVFGLPPGVTPATSSHAVIAAAIALSDLPDAFASALHLIAAFAIPAGRVEIENAASALGYAKRLPLATSPADLMAALVTAAPTDGVIAAIVEAAKIIRGRSFPPRLTSVHLGAPGVDAAIGDPSQYTDPMKRAVGAWCAETGRGSVIDVVAHGDLRRAVLDVIHEDREETILTRAPDAAASIAATIARPVRSHRVVYESESERGLLWITTDVQDALMPLARIAGDVLFGDSRHFLRQSPYTLWPLQNRGKNALELPSLAGELAAVRAISGTWHSGKKHAMTPRGKDFFEALARYKIRIDGGRLDAITLRAERRKHDGGPPQFDVTLRPPHLLTCSEPELAPLMNEMLDAAGITRPEAPLIDFFSRQPWIHPRAPWIESEGDIAFEALVARGILVADRSNRAVAHPEYSYAGRLFSAYELSDGRFLAVSADVPIAPFVVDAEDLVVYRLAFAKLAALVAEELGLCGPAIALDDDGVLFCGRREIGPTYVLLFLLTRPIRRATVERLRTMAGHGHAILITPRARMTEGGLRQIAMPSLIGPWRPLLADIVRALDVASLVDTSLYAPVDARIVVHRATTRGWIDGTLCDQLSENHLRLLELLARHPEELVHTKDLAKHIAQGNGNADTTRKTIEGMIDAVRRSFTAQKTKPPKDLAELIEMPKHGCYRLSVIAFVVE